MTCHEARELFSDRVDEQLTADGAARLAAHLADCHECRLEWERFERVVSLVQAVEPSRAPAGFVDRVLEAARPVPWPLRLVRYVFTPMRIKLPLEVAALLLVGGLAVMIFQRSPEMQRVVRQEAAPQTAAPQVPTPPPDVRAPQSDAPAGDRIARSDPTPAAPPTPQSSLARQSETAAQPAIARSAPAPPATAAPGPAPTAQPSVVQEQRRDTTDSARRESVAKSAAPPPAAAPLAARARPPAPDVSAWLTVADREVALTALAETVARFGGRENARRSEGRADVVDVAIPRDAYDAFIREVSRLGGFAAERPPAELPASVSISLRITE